MAAIAQGRCHRLHIPRLSQCLFRLLAQILTARPPPPPPLLLLRCAAHAHPPAPARGGAGPSCADEAAAQARVPRHSGGLPRVGMSGRQGGRLGAPLAGWTDDGELTCGRLGFAATGAAWRRPCSGDGATAAARGCEGCGRCRRHLVCTLSVAVAMGQECALLARAGIETCHGRRFWKELSMEQQPNDDSGGGGAHM